MILQVAILASCKSCNFARLASFASASANASASKYVQVQAITSFASFAKLLVVAQVLPACMRSFSSVNLCIFQRTPYKRQDINNLLLNSFNCSCDDSESASLATAIKDQMTHSMNNPGCLSYTELLMLNTL